MPLISTPRLPGGVFLVPGPCAPNVHRLDRNVLPVLNKMTRYGIMIDRAGFQTLGDELDDRIGNLTAELEDLAGRVWNPGSEQQVSDMVYKELGLKTRNAAGDICMPPTTHGGRFHSTADEYLSQLSDHPLVSKILDYRELSKLNSTYVQGIAAKADSDNRVRCRWNYTSVLTGRLSSADPNMQNWPARNQEWAQRIRGLFVPAPGCKLVSHDLSQIEMRIGAHMSRDPRLISSFTNRIDTHTMTAAYVFYRSKALERGGEGLKEAMEMVTKWQRAACKTVNFGIFYGQTAEGLQMGLAAMGNPQTLDWCQWLINEWYTLYEGVKDYLDRVQYQARRFGMVWDMFGRVRLVPEAQSALKHIISAGLRQAGNMPIQGSAQGVLKVGMYCMNQVYDMYEAGGKICRPILQIHDEMITEVSEDVADEFAELGKTDMELAVPLVVPTECGYSVGDNWGQLK